MVTSAGEFAAASFPDIYDQTGQPVALTAELARGSIVRVSASATGMMMAVQLIDPRYQNPFARLAHYARRSMAMAEGNPWTNPWPTEKANVFWGYHRSKPRPIGRV